MDGKPMTSCLVLAASAAGRKIITIGEYSRAGYTLYKGPLWGAIQCGQCTPGMMVAARAFGEGP